MKKLIPLALIVVAGSVVIAALRSGSADERKARLARRMRDKIESMPEDFPPRMMHENLAATRTNTERILSILEADDSAVTAQRAAAREPG